MREPSQSMAPSQEGHWQSKDFQIRWHGTLSASGWVIVCTLSQHATNCQYTLDRRTLSQQFELGDAEQQVWGTLALCNVLNEVDCLALEMDLHCEPMLEEVQRLCSWRVCDPCSSVLPTQGQQTLGKRGEIKASWTIAGADQACLEAEITLDGGQGSEVIHLNPLQPDWQGNIRLADGFCELRLQLQINDHGAAQIDVRLRQAAVAGECVELDRFIAAAPPVDEPSAPWPEHGVALERPREFASFALPRNLMPPSPGQWARRFASISNTSDFQNTLRALPTTGRRQAMQAEAADFSSATSQKYKQQWVSCIGELDAPLSRLEGEPVWALLTMQPESRSMLLAALQQLFGEPVQAVVEDPAFLTQQQRLQNSLLALMLTESLEASQGDTFCQALRVCHVASMLAAAPTQELSQLQLQDLLQANILLPTALMLPTDTALPGGYARPLGFSDIRVIQQNLLRYRLGEVAHIENIMCGEALERSEEISRHSETHEREVTTYDRASERAAHNGSTSQQQQENQVSPLGTLKREFDNLKQEYGTDGLSVTASGAWTDSQTGMTSFDKQASNYAQQLLEQASARVARKVETERSRRSVEEFVERRRRRFDNLSGSQPLIGVYRWVDAIHRVQVVPNGTRLIVEIVIANPAQAYVRRCNALNGIDLQAPIAPWLGGDGIAPIKSPADITRDNQPALASRYNTTLPPAPPLNLVRSAALGAHPQQSRACLEIPEDYVVAGGNIGYGWTRQSDTSSSAVPLEILLGDTVFSIDPAQASAPGTLPLSAMPVGTTLVPITVLTSGLDFAVHVTLHCSCAADSPSYLQWQIAVYREIMAAYQLRRSEYLASLSVLANQAMRPAPDATRDVAAAELQTAAIGCLMAPALQQIPSTRPAWQRDAIIMSETQFFRDALEWQDSICSYYPQFFSDDDPARPDWLALIRTPDSPPGFTEFIEAGCARLLVPLRTHAILPLLYYLSTNGQSWHGSDATTPVCEVDGWLANTLKSIAQSPAPAVHCESWEMMIPTSMLMLQTDARLPNQLGDEGLEA